MTQKRGKAEGLKGNTDHPTAKHGRAVNSTQWEITSEPHITCELHMWEMLIMQTCPSIVHGYKKPFSAKKAAR